MWSILLLACAREPGGYVPPASDTEPTDAPVSQDLPEPDRTADELAADIEALLAQPPPDPVTVHNDAFVWIMGQGDSQCPAGLSFRIGDCTSGGGWRYFGIADYFEEQGEALWGASLTLGDMLITSPDGEVSLIGGTFDLLRDGDHFTGDVTGTFQFPALGGWFSSGSFAWWIEADLAEGAERLALDGALGAGAGGGLHFDEVVFGGDCGEAPTGALQLREPSGRWYRVAFADSCDGCGSLVYAEQVEMGEVCIDTGTFFADTIAQLRAAPAVLEF